MDEQIPRDRNERGCGCQHKMSQPGKAAVAERSQVAGVGELVEKVLDARQTQKQEQGNSQVGRMMRLAHRGK